LFCGDGVHTVPTFYIIDYQHELPSINHEFFMNLISDNLWLISDNSCFFLFSHCVKENFPIFAIANSGEIDLARESAFFALFLDSKSGQFT